MKKDVSPAIDSIEDIIQEEDKDKLEELSRLYIEGLTSTSKMTHHKIYDLAIMTLTTIASVCTGVIICYLMYIYI